MKILQTDMVIVDCDARLDARIKELEAMIETAREEREQLRIRVWNRVLNMCGGIGSERQADYVIEAFDRPMDPPGSPLSRVARRRLEEKQRQ